MIIFPHSCQIGQHSFKTCLASASLHLCISALCRLAEGALTAKPRLPRWAPTLIQTEGVSGCAGYRELVTQQLEQSGVYFLMQNEVEKGDCLWLT